MRKTGKKTNREVKHWNKRLGNTQETSQGGKGNKQVIWAHEQVTRVNNQVTILFLFAVLVGELIHLLFCLNAQLFVT